MKNKLSKIPETLCLTKLKSFFAKHPVSKYPKGYLIIKPGDVPKEISFIKSGFVRLYTKTNNRECTLNIFKPLFIVSMTQILSNQPNDFYLEALTSCEVWHAPFEKYQEFIDSDKKTAQYFTKFFFDSLLNFLKNQSNIIQGSAENKVATLLLQLANDFGKANGNISVVEFPATHRIVANLIGLTRETTSVQMSKLQKQKLISTKRKSFTVLDIKKLEKYAYS